MRYYNSLLILLLATFSFSCQEEEVPKLDPASNNAANSWILNVMDEVYLWLDDLGTPIAENSDPEDYFEALLFRPTDRFSVIYPDYQELINALNGVNLEAGYEFILYRENPTSDNVVAEVSYIKKNSPASNVDLQRGDVINKINGTVLTIGNYQQLLGEIDGMHTLSYSRFDEESEGFVAKPDVTLTAVQLAENPNFLDTIYTVNGEKIGYVVYHFFAPGPGENSTAYDNEMDGIFGKFKAEGIDHLIVDFRYNSGGYVSSAVNLASLIAPGVSSSSIFSKTKYNSYLMEELEQLRNVQTSFLAKNQNLGNTMEGNRVYILTTSRTASASELIINGLKPYMDVAIVGDTTTGKNVGSIPFEDEENDQNNYGILPIVSQSFNSLDQSDYTEGFVPNITLKESQERLRPLGDINELLLRTAIGQITGITSGARFQQLDRLDVGSSLEGKIRSGVMIENPILK
ncbi:S41 family peptidase [Algoriphagus sp. A40]|uniref:S41 family peptidase n=1 Tax=Algoriphagus sp. A40 TaxID=1945863 RepID=UPI000985341C|nr:S41 family peptidase [Algoriphagus sp. A40]OOG77425.1 peptidase [Algoriphagus sp. A40]